MTKERMPDQLWIDNYSKEGKGPNSTTEPCWAADKYLLSTPTREAAHELLEALNACLNYIGNTENELGIELDSGVKARAAIAKAKGEAQ